ncbi:MAG: phage tail protein [Alphaproteobacteria bacterium CG11_big_fil_rev_8_21_14_0_20_39_49]|nr:MAG: phage tail protein [Alphaproteobacteria bacterium CG11_big_fil_rev_8_21_14_0_20_39_49]
MTITPNFRVIADSNDITAAIRRGLLSLSITDEAGFQSDKVTIKLDDRDGKIALPRTGATLDISLGYKETSLIRMGLYVVDEVSLESPPQSMSIRTHAADMGQVLKAPVTKTWGKITLGDLVSNIAGKHGLNPRITDNLASFEIPHLVQTEESDLHLLTRLALAHDAISKPVNGNLLFAPKGEARSVSGLDIPPVTISRKQITSWNASFADRAKYGAVEGDWYDKDEAIKKTIKIGEGEPVYKLRHTYDSPEVLIAAADAKLKQLERGTGSLEITTPGNPRLAAEGKLDIADVRSGVNGQWNIIRVEHSLDNSGYICRVSAEIPQQQ